MQIGVDKVKLLQVMKEIEKDYGCGSVYTLDSKKAQMQMPRWSTAIEDLNEIIGGGMPYGRIVTIYGAKSSGKTTLAYHLAAQHECAVYIPIEGAQDLQRAKMMGNRKGQFIVRRADYGEQCLKATLDFAQAGVPLVIIDSVPSMIPKRQFEEENLEKEHRGMISSMLSAKLPKIVTTCEKTNTTVIFINQVRDNQNAMLFAPQHKMPGGNALEHYSSVIMKINRVDWIKTPNKNPKNSAKDEAVGITIKVKIEKSKICNPLGECMLAVMFDRGFVAVDDVAIIRKEIMQRNNKNEKE